LVARTARLLAHRFRYYRYAQLSVFFATSEAVGIHLTSLQIARYSQSRDEATIRNSSA
jgi:hypothetical protein